jgi:hypothetical protein
MQAIGPRQLHGRAGQQAQTVRTAHKALASGGSPAAAAAAAATSPLCATGVCKHHHLLRDPLRKGLQLARVWWLLQGKHTHMTRALRKAASGRSRTLCDDTTVCSRNGYMSKLLDTEQHCQTTRVSCSKAGAVSCRQQILRERRIYTPLPITTTSSSCLLFTSCKIPHTHRNDSLYVPFFGPQPSLFVLTHHCCCPDTPTAAADDVVRLCIAERRETQRNCTEGAASKQQGTHPQAEHS